MAIIVVAELPGGTAEQDEAMVKEVGGDTNPPAGMLMRLAGPIPGGWRIVTIWESEEAFQSFRRDRLLPMLAKRGGPTPQLQMWPMQSVRTPQR
jgi:hypothetical protein